MSFTKKSKDEQASYIDSFIRHSNNIINKLPDEQDTVKELLDSTMLNQISITPIESGN